MANLGDLVVRIVGDNSQLDQSIDKSKQKAEQFQQSMANIGKKLTTFVTLPILGIGAAAVKSAADLEVQQAAFETMLGSADKAKGLLQDLTDLAAKTPFQLTDLADASKTMLAFGISVEDVLPNVQMLGDIAQGDSEKFKSLTLAFSQIQSTGRLMGQDLLQLINAGFNPLQVISEQTGQSMADLKDQMSRGAISAQQVADAFKIATSEGGRFFGGMERASQTLAGQVSTLKDNVAAAGRSFAEVLIPAISDAVKWATELAQKFAAFDEDTKKTILTVAAIAAAMGPLALGIAGAIKAVNALNAAITFLAANPVVAIVAGLAAVTAGLVAIGHARRESQLEEIAQEFAGVQTASGLAAEEIEAVRDALRLGSLDGLTNAKDQVKALSENLGISQQAIIDIGIASDDVTDSYKEQLQLLKDQFTEQIAIGRLMTDSWLANQREREAADARAAEILRQRAEAEARLEAQRKAIQDRANEAYSNIATRLATINSLEQFNLSIGQEYDANAERRKAILDEINSLITDGTKLHTNYAGALTYIKSLYGDILGLTKDEKDATDDLTDSTWKWLHAKDAAIAAAQEQAAIEAAAAEKAKQRIINEQEADRILAESTARRIAEQQALEDGAYFENIDRINNLAAHIKETNEETADDYKQWTELVGGYMQSIIGDTIGALVAGENAWAAFGKSALNAIAGIVDGIGQQLLIQATEATVLALLGDVTKIPAATGAAIGAATAFAASALIRGIAAQLATGGIVMPTPGGTPAIVGEGGQPEAVIPLDQLGAVLREFGGSAAGADGNINMQINLDGKPIARFVTEATRNRQIIVDARAVTA